MSFSANTGKKKRKTFSEINITPMVDVMSILLITFIVVAPMIEQGVDLDLPATETVAIESPQEKFILRIPENQKIYIGNTEVLIDQLEEKLKTNEKLKTQKEVYLYASKKLKYGYVVRVMAIVKKAGIPKISLVTEPLEKE